MGDQGDDKQSDRVYILGVNRGESPDAIYGATAPGAWGECGTEYAWEECHRGRSLSVV
jgi:hypothetical protein